MGTLIKATGECTKVAPQNGTDYSLDELQGYVGGIIEIVHITRNIDMVVNDEGLLLKLKPNAKASLLAGQLIVGDVLITKMETIK